MLVLFDIDGTLIRTGGVGGRALGRAVAKLHGWQDALAGLDLAGMTDPWIVDAIFHRQRGRGATAAELAQVIEAYLPLLAEELAAAGDRYQVLPGVERAIAHALERGALVGLATGNVEPAARLKLTPGRLHGHFSYGGYGSDARERAELVSRGVARGLALSKTKTATATATAKATATATKTMTMTRSGAARTPDVWVIGDTVHDITAAHAAGARAVGVASGGSSREVLAAAEPEILIDSLEDLVL
jgi:phosphoglycolate phosphatase-like HAD superfamily hydrolase